MAKSTMMITAGWGFAASFWLAAFPYGCRADNLSMKTIVNVQGDAELHRPGSVGYDHIAATFGMPQDPAKIVLPLIYAGEGSPLCTLNDFDPSGINAPFALLVDRGGCGFGRKAKFAEDYGASALVYADDSCVCTHTTCQSDNGEQCKPHAAVVANNNPERVITIPSVMLFKEDADPIRDYLMSGKNLHLQLKFELPVVEEPEVEAPVPPNAAGPGPGPGGPSPGGPGPGPGAGGPGPGGPSPGAGGPSRGGPGPGPGGPGPYNSQQQQQEPAPQQSSPTVHFDWWTTPTDKLSKTMEYPLSKTVLALQDTGAEFAPHEFIYDGAAAGCRGGNARQTTVGGQSCQEACTNHGRYCAADDVIAKAPDGILGSQIVAESLRRLCIWKLYGQDNGVGAEWWMYLQNFGQMCEAINVPTSSFSQPQCIAVCMTRAQIDKQAVEECMDKAGGIDQDQRNALLEATMADQRDAGVVNLPSVYVNGATVAAFVGWGVFDAVCHGFDAAHAPPICRECVACRNKEACLQAGKCPNELLDHAHAAQIAQEEQAEEQVEVQEEAQEEENVAVDLEKMDGMDVDEEQVDGDSP